MNNRSEFTKSVGGCARCGEDHNALAFRPIDRHERYTHFATCPNTGQPVLLRQTDPRGEVCETCGKQASQAVTDVLYSGQSQTDEAGAKWLTCRAHSTHWFCQDHERTPIDYMECGGTPEATR